MRHSILDFALVATSSLAWAQQLGTTPEEHPPLPTYKCTKAGGCVQQNTSVVLDYQYRNVTTSTGVACYVKSKLNTQQCPDAATCFQNCFVAGMSAADYAAAGISVSGDALTLKQWMPSTKTAGDLDPASPRVYILDADGQNYAMLNLLGHELSYDVDASALPCGENGAVYLSSMDAAGGRTATNPGGAAYGGGYCDAQCPVQAWLNGAVNTAGKGFCCHELDIVEGNARASAFTPHPCTANGPGTDMCDKNGCGFNPYAKGFKNYFGPGGTVDTNKKHTVTTRFVADASGALGRIERVYTQNGRTVASAVSGGDVITAAACSSSNKFGGMTAMGKALDVGMVLIFSLWVDQSGQKMNWLDTGGNGPCGTDDGDPAVLKKKAPGAQVVFSNIRWGDIGTTVTKG